MNNNNNNNNINLAPINLQAVNEVNANNDDDNFVTPVTTPVVAVVPSAPRPNRRRTHSEAEINHIINQPIFNNNQEDIASLQNLLNLVWNDQVISNADDAENTTEMIQTRNRYNQLSRIGTKVVDKYEGQINLDNMSVTDIFDLTTDDNNVDIPELKKPSGFLRANPDNIIFVFENHLFFSNKDFVSNALREKSMIKFECINVNTMRSENIKRETPYLSYKFIGVYIGLVSVLQTLGLLYDGKKVFYVHKTNTKFASTVSLDVLYGGDRVSASHCQEGQDEFVYTLEYIDFPLGTGGKKRKTRKRRNSKRVRKNSKERKFRKQKKTRSKTRK